MIVHYDKRTRLSARLLARGLYATGYSGRAINWGTKYPEAINSPEAVALASNKRQALYTMKSAGVPVPDLFEPDEVLDMLQMLGPVVGRTTYHRKGRGFWLCKTEADVRVAINQGVSHFLDYIDDAREFRVHIVNGKSIKISEKIGGGVTKNYDSGARFRYPDFDHKQSLRKVAKQAVESLGLDFGAVDVLHKDGKFYVLEVNTAPALTCEQSDTLQRYVKAFKEEYD